MEINGATIIGFMIGVLVCDICYQSWLLIKDNDEYKKRNT
jgi:hypothetical protein